MDTRRLILYAALAILGFMLWTNWQKEHPVQAPQTAQENGSSAPVSAQSGFVPQVTHVSQSNQTKQTASSQPTSSLTPDSPQTSNNLISVSTDDLDVKIDLVGGSIVSAKLKKYPVKYNEPNIPFQLLSPELSRLYVIQSGVTGTSSSKPIQFTSSQRNYSLPTDAKASQILEVKLTGRTANGLKLTKTYTFKPKSYAVTVAYTIQNAGSKAWRGNVYQQITRRNFVMPSSWHSRSYTGASLSSPAEPYIKWSFKKLDKMNISETIKDGWVAMQQQYFLSVLIPNPAKTIHYYSHTQTPPGTDGKSNIYTVGLLSPLFNLAVGESQDYQTTLYMGPISLKNLTPLANNLERTIDYGKFFWYICMFLFWLLSHIHSVVGNWGWAIVILTLLVKLAFAGLSAKSYRSMAKMRLLQPRMQAIKERCGDDRAAMSKATMELYKKEKVNPMSSCLPMVVQMPVFFSLYYVLIESVELRQAPFMFWIHDLSVHDPYYILPILMGLSMLLQQKLSPPPPDPTQAKMMMFLPIIFTAVFLTFPAGLVLYWLVNNCVSILQQWYIMKTFDPKAEKKKETAKKKKKQGKYKSLMGKK